MEPPPIPSTQSITATSLGIRRLTTRPTATPILQNQVSRDVTRDRRKVSTPTLAQLPGCPAAPLSMISQDDISIRVTEKQKMQALSLAHTVEERLPLLVMQNSLITIYSYDELKDEAVVTVTEPKLEGPNSINDPRMGVVEHDKLCSTCHKDSLECSGHLGMIRLNEPVYHPLFMRLIISVLTVVCNTCSGLLLSREDMEKMGLFKLTGLTRLKRMEEIVAKGSYCRRRSEDPTLNRCLPNPKFKTASLKTTKKIMFVYKEGKAKEKEKEKELPIYKVEEILNVISVEDAALMGFSNGSHPRRFILHALPVIPPCDRSPVTMDGVVLPDHLTIMYMYIVKKNKELLTVAANENRETIANDLYDLIEHLIDNSDGKYTQGPRIKLNTIKPRIQGKEGLIRGAMMGKRVNYSARTVLGPDPSLRIDEIGVPEVMAPFLTRPVIVNDMNRAALTQLLRAGRVTHIISGSGPYRGSRRAVTSALAKTKELMVGDIVERWLQTGDFVVFNRQPTLHKQSMMGYKAILRPQLTFTTSLPVTPAHNADYDGDEANVHAPQTLGSQVEVRELMNVRNCIMNAQKNQPMIGVVYDGLTGSHLLTQDDTEVDYDVYQDCLMLLSNQEGLASFENRLRRFNLHINRFYINRQSTSPSGEQIISKIEVTPDQITTIYQPINGGPPNISIDQLDERVRYYDENNNPVVVSYEDFLALRRTNIQMRRADPNLQLEDPISSTVRVLKSNPSLIYEYQGRLVLAADYSIPVEARRVVKGKTLFSAVLPEDFYYRKGDVVVVDGILIKGVVTKEHIGIARGSMVQAIWNDYTADRTTDFISDLTMIVSRWLTSRGFSVSLQDCYPHDPSFRQFLHEEVAKVNLQVAALGTALDDPVEEERREQQIRGIVDVVKNTGARITAERLTRDNSLKIMVESGAKGSVANIAQITGIIGQQFVQGERMPLTLTGGTRCSTYFERGDLDPRARGFCVGSFLTGLDPAAMFNVQAAGREGLMDTAVRTSETGSIHHRIIKALEDIKVSYDGSVRNAVGTIFQYVYGQDGFDPSQLEIIKTPTGEYPSFINLQRVVGRLNAKYGFYQTETTEESMRLGLEIEIEREFTYVDEYDDDGE